MRKQTHSAFGALLVLLSLSSQLSAQDMNTAVVHIAELEVAPARFEEFKPAGIENITCSLRTEPDTLELHAVSLRAIPGRVVVLEVYKDQRAYLTHCESQHFKRFGAVIASMMTNKKLHDATPIILGRKSSLSSPNPYVRIAEIDVEPSQFDAYKTAVVEEINASISAEPGVLAIFCVALNDEPNQLRFLEIYADEIAYQRHRESPHFKKYLAVAKQMIRSLRLFEADPILLERRYAPDASSNSK